MVGDGINKCARTRRRRHQDLVTRRHRGRARTADVVLLEGVFAISEEAKHRMINNYSTIAAALHAVMPLLRKRRVPSLLGPQNVRAG
ncbi:MAG: hypothetical protein NVS3B20_07060 [Polyangiales bacterium]